MVKLTRLFTSVFCFLLLVSSFALQARESTIFFHNDILGSPVLATDETGNVLGRENYSPFGERQIKDPAASGNSLWFAGKPQDEASGLSYFNARYYSPLLGRFISVDPVDPIVGNIHHFNRYAYANNNPSKFIDPDGELPVLLAPIAWNVARYIATEAVAMAVEEFAPDIPLSKKGLLNRAVRDGIKHMPGSIVKTGVPKGVETQHIVNTGGKAPKTSNPNSIIESRRADGSSSATYYDDKGRAFSREDYGQQSVHGSLGTRADGRSVAHEHRFDYNERGYPVKQSVYRELSENGTPIGSWVGEK